MWLNFIYNIPCWFSDTGQCLRRVPWYCILCVELNNAIRTVCNIFYRCELHLYYTLYRSVLSNFIQGLSAVSQSTRLFVFFISRIIKQLPLFNKHCFLQYANNIIFALDIIVEAKALCNMPALQYIHNWMVTALRAIVHHKQTILKYNLSQILLL